MVAVSLVPHPDSFDYGRKTTASLTHLTALRIYWSISSLVSILRSYTMFSFNPAHGTLVDWGPMTTVANSVDSHGWSSSQGIAHSDTVWHS